MNLRFRFGFLACLTVFTPALADGFTAPADAAIRAHELLASQIAPKVPGLAAAVAVDGRLVWSDAIGFADLEARKPVDANTRFRIGSISKSLTAAGLMRLVERGAIDLDAPVQTYVRDFPVKAEGAVTTRLLAGHIAGIRHYRNREQFLNRPFSSVLGAMKLFEDDPLIAPPGTKFSYSSYGWVVISAVMESAANRDFLDFMQSDVIAPLDLNHTRPDRAGAVDPDRAKFYAGGPDGGFVAAPTVDSSYMWAGGGFLSNAEDLVRFGSAMIRAGYLSGESRRLLFTSQKTLDGDTTGYGIGWFVTADGKGRAIYYHDGGSHGGTAVLLIRPDTKSVAAIVCNMSGADINGQAMKLADLFAPLRSGDAN